MLSARLPLVLGAAIFAAGPVPPAASALTAPPPNDNFAGAQFLPGPTNTISANNTGATVEAGEPQHLRGRGPFDSVWYRWTAPATGSVIFRTQGSVFDTVLAAYAGSALSSATQLASNDDTPFGDGSTRQSQIRFAVTKGTEYRIAVDGFSPTNFGAIKLSWTSNDDFSSPETLTGPPAGGITTVGGNTTGSTEQPGEPVHAGVSGAGSVWYTWKAPASASTEITTLPTGGFASILGVYGGNSLNTLGTVAAHAGGGPTPGGSQVVFKAQAGTTYRIAVAGPGVAPTETVTQGSFTLRLRQLPPQVLVGDGSIVEGNAGTKNLALPVALTAASPVPVSLSFTVSSGSATAGSDFTVPSGQLSIPAGATVGTIAVPIKGDTVKELNEQFRVTVTAATGGGATIADGSATATILNDD